MTFECGVQLGTAKGAFNKKVGNEGWLWIWRRKLQLGSAPAGGTMSVLTDFCGWCWLDSKSSNGSSPDMIQHTQVLLLKDVIVPYTHLIPRSHLSEDQRCHTLL